jgi:hypothetical protein
MRAFIGAKLLSSKVAQPTTKPFEIYDTRLPGFTFRVQPGVRSFYARFGRSRRIALGKVGTLLPDEAREKCQRVLGNVAHGRGTPSGTNELTTVAPATFARISHPRLLRVRRLPSRVGDDYQGPASALAS